MTRRTLLQAGFGTLVPPQVKSIYAPGETLTYASQRLLTRNSLAREFPRTAISTPFANTQPLEAAAARPHWTLAIEGMVAKPQTLTLAELKSLPTRSQVTQLICEEGWSFIAEWTGVPLASLLERAGILPQARYVVYFSLDPKWWDSIDMADALHPQTLLTFAMNGSGLPPAHGGPLRMRVPRQLGYKSVKWIHRVVATDDLKPFAVPGDYSWYGGI